MAEFDIEADEDGGVRPARPIVDEDDDEEEDEKPAPAPPPKNKGGRPRKGVAEAVHVRGAEAFEKPPTPPPPSLNLPPGASPDDDEKSEPKLWSKDVLEVWPRLIRYLARRGLGASEVIVSVSRIPHGPYPGEEARLSSIRGASIAGHGNVSPSEALMRYVVDVYHSIAAPGARSGCGPMLYKFTFMYARGGSIIKSAELALASYAELIAQREREAQMNAYAEQQQQGPEEGQAYPPMVPPQMGAYGRPARPGMPPQMPPGYPPFAPSAPSAADPYAQQYIDMLQSQLNAALDRQGQPPVFVPPPAPVVSEDERLAKIVAAANEAMLKNLIALGIIPTPGAQPAITQPTPAATPAAAVTQTTSMTDGFSQMIADAKRFKKMQGEMREVLGIEEVEEKEEVVTPQTIVVEGPDNKPMQTWSIPRPGGPNIVLPRYGKDDETPWYEKLMNLAASNHGMTQEFFAGLLEKAASTLTQGQMGELIAKMIAQGGGAAASAVASSMATNGAGKGWGPSA